MRLISVEHELFTASCSLFMLIVRFLAVFIVPVGLETQANCLCDNWTKVKVSSMGGATYWVLHHNIHVMLYV